MIRIGRHRVNLELRFTVHSTVNSFDVVECADLVDAFRIAYTHGILFNEQIIVPDDMSSEFVKFIETEVLRDEIGHE